jgi:glutamine transport system substrate-binding protein
MRLLLLLLTVVGLTLVACGGGSSGTRVGVDATNPPFEYLDKDAELVGFDIALMEAIAEEAGFAIEWVDLTRGGFTDALAEDTVDLTIAGATLPVQVSEGLTVTNEVISNVVQTIDLSDPFFVAEERFYRADWSGGVEHIGYEVGSLTFTPDQRVPSTLVFKGYPTLEGAFGALQEGAVDAVHAGRHQVSFRLPQAAEAYRSINAQYVEYMMSIRKGSNLSSTVNTALQTLIDDGTYAALYVEWFDDSVPYAYRPVDEREDAVVEQARTLLDMGRILSGGIAECLSMSDWIGCLDEIGRATVEQAGGMEVQPAMRPLHSGLVELARACSGITDSNLDQLATAVGDYQSIARRIAATFVR